MTATYTHNPRPVGGPVSFILTGDRLTVDSGRKVQEVRLGAVEAVRLTYEPGRFGLKAFRTRIRMKDGKTFTFSSLNWKSLAEAQTLSREYRTFATALFEAIARANPNTRFLAGRPAAVWFATAVVAIGSLLAMAFLIWRALQMNATGIAVMGALFALIGIWQIEPMLRLNKPRPFRPDAPPPELFP